MWAKAAHVLGETTMSNKKETIQYLQQRFGRALSFIRKVEAGRRRRKTPPLSFWVLSLRGYAPRKRFCGKALQDVDVIHVLAPSFALWASVGSLRI